MTATGPATGGSAATGRQRQIYKAIQQQIVSGALCPGDRLPTRAEMRTRYRTTPVTVQRAFDRLRQAGFVVTKARAGTFVAPNPPHRNRYGLVLAGTETPTEEIRFWTVMASIARNLSAAGGRQSVAVYANEARYAPDGNIESLAQDITDRRLAGIVFATTDDMPREGGAAREAGLPCITFATPGKPGRHTMYIQLDIAGFFSRAVDRLMDRGRRRIASISAPRGADSVARHLQRALKRRGLPLAPEWMQVAPYTTARAWGMNLAALLFSLPPQKRPDGVIITDDNLLAPAYAGILAAGLRPGRDLNIVSHCNHPVIEPPPAGVDLLGFDNEQVLCTCIAHIDAFHAGAPMPARARVQARFSEETNPSGPVKVSS